tara:strand:- start:2448 stop:3374 length:927 start_codon:yes stop_codon:yes gene_type:complete
MKLIKITLIIFYFTISISSKSFCLDNKILVKVNNEIITSIDVLNEIKYISLINQDFKNFDKFKIFEISKNSLIKEKIKKNELYKNFKRIEIKDEYLEPLIVNYFQRFGVNTIDDFEKLMNLNNLQAHIIKKKITIELMWNQIIFKKFSNNVKINKELIKKQLLKNDKKNEYLLSEIVFDISDKEKINNKFNMIKESIINDGFSNTVLQYSISDSAKNNGKLGWIKETSLSSKIQEQVIKTKIGNLTKPIQIPGGFLILKVENKRDMEISLDVDKEINLIVKKKTNEQLDQFSNIYFKKVMKDIKINEL